MQHLRWNPFIAIANYMRPLTIIVNISIIKVLDQPLTKSLFYHTKAILTSIMPEFWQQETFGAIYFLTYLMVNGFVRKFVFWYFYILFVSIT